MSLVGWVKEDTDFKGFKESGGNGDRYIKTGGFVGDMSTEEGKRTNSALRTPEIL